MKALLLFVVLFMSLGVFAQNTNGVLIPECGVPIDAFVDYYGTWLGEVMKVVFGVSVMLLGGWLLGSFFARALRS